LQIEAFRHMIKAFSGAGLLNSNNCSKNLNIIEN